MWKLVSSSFSNDSGETRNPDRLDSAGSRDVRCRTCKQRAASRPRRKASSAHRPRECGAHCARDGQHPPAQGECLLAKPKETCAAGVGCGADRCSQEPHVPQRSAPAQPTSTRAFCPAPRACLPSCSTRLRAQRL